MKLTSGVVALAWFVGIAAGERILGLFPYKGATHFYVIQPLLEELARRGHSVDVVSHLPRSEPLANYTDIPIEDVDDPSMSFLDFRSFEETKTSFFTNLWGSRKMQSLLSLTKGYEKAHSRPEVLALANSSYDLVITEMFNTDLFYGLIYRIGAPVVGFSSCHVFPWSEDSMAVPSEPAYLPNVIGGRGPRMGFFERLMNYLEVWTSRAFYRLVIHPRAQRMAERFLGELPDLADIAANTSLFLVNSHFSLLGHRPLPPSVVEVGGLNVRDPKPLPEDLEKVFKQATGVIYFSMGSILVGYTLPKKKEAMFTSALAKSGRTVLWKWESNVSTAKHPNIITRRWFPQGDVLAQPKTELFIGHCGLLGLNEAVARGVPVICIPMYGDQPTNSEYVKELGIGIVLDYWTLTEEKIHKAISEILYTKKYKQRMADVSAAFNERVMSPVNTSVFWIEYLLKHGPNTIRSPYSGMPLWKRLGLDLEACIFIVSFIFLVLFLYLLTRVWKLFIKVVYVTENTLNLKKKIGLLSELNFLKKTE